MHKTYTDMFGKFRKYWQNYILQSVLATLTIFIILLLIRWQNLVIISSLGASGFILFAMPQDITARPRNLIGGHMVGLISGIFFGLIPHPSWLHGNVIYALAVGFSIFVMVVIDTEHPPAAATALGVASSKFSIQLILTIVVCVLVLSLIHHLLKRNLKNLV